MREAPVLWLLVGAIVVGVVSTVRPRSRLHWILGAVSVAALVAALIVAPSGEGRSWLVVVATLAALGLTAFGVAMLLARRHPRRVQRHIIYTGYGLVFGVVAVCWELAVRFPGHDVAAAICSVVAYFLGSVAIAAYKSQQTGQRTADPTDPTPPSDPVQPDGPAP